MLAVDGAGVVLEMIVPARAEYLTSCAVDGDGVRGDDGGVGGGGFGGGVGGGLGRVLALEAKCESDGEGGEGEAHRWHPGWEGSQTVNSPDSG